MPYQFTDAFCTTCETGNRARGKVSDGPPTKIITFLTDRNHRVSGHYGTEGQVDVRPAGTKR
ncbi:hypothetical protein GCM10027404_32980 [Arthrobacter tumbae]